MTQSRIEQDLDELLGEDVAHASARAASQSPVGSSDAIVLYGAGTLGRSVLRRLRAAGIEPAAFADDTQEKQGQTIDGLPVMSPGVAAGKLGGKAVFVVTILNPALSFVEARSRLAEATGARVVSFLDVAWQYPEALLPFHQFELPQVVLSKADDIRRTFHLWEDEESQRQFVAHLRFRLFLDYEALPRNTRDDYFPSDVLPTLPPKTTFVDCGAYDGDTIRGFLQHQNHRFHKIFAFEPDEGNFQKLREYVSTLGADASRTQIYNAGVASQRTRMRFDSTGNTGAALSDNGTVEVDVMPIQEMVPNEDGVALYVKFDVEGAELEALKGMEQLIREATPILAVSVYHRPDDLWTIPVYLKSLNPSYKLFLRTQGEDGMDVICYAVPQSNL